MLRTLIGIAAIAACATLAHADGIAYWAENTNVRFDGSFGFELSDFPQGADFGAQAGTANLTVGGGDVLAADPNGVCLYIQSFTGSTINAQYGEPFGGSIAVQGGTNNVNNGAWIELAFDATSWTAVNFSFAGRRTSTGFIDVDIDAYNGTTLLGSIAADVNLNATTLTLYSYAASLLDGVADARIRLTLNGATSATGNVRLDNLYIEGVPEPTGLLLLGLGVLALRRR
jgi:hypothetical protein